MTIPARCHGYRAATATILLVGGVGVAIATWLGGNHAWAIAAIVAYARSPSELTYGPGAPATSLHCGAVVATNVNAD
jgi:hypothetical protein